MVAVDGVDLSLMVRGGVAVVVATVDTSGRPAITRGWGPVYEESSDLMKLTVTAPAGSSTLANLESNGAIAVTISDLLTYATVQLKGVVEHVGAPSESDRAKAHEHLGCFVEAAAQLGLDRGVEGLFLGDLRVVEVHVGEIFLQTPGAKAGSRLQ